MFLLSVTLTLAAPVPKAKPTGVDIRDPSGTVLVSAADIRRYDWKTHTFTVPEPVKARLADDGPTEFEVCVNGKPVYRGKFWRALADEPCPGPVILLGHTPADQIRIEFNYGGVEPTTDEDVRRDRAIRNALESAGTLTNTPSDGK